MTERWEPNCHIRDDATTQKNISVSLWRLMAAYLTKTACSVSKARRRCVAWLPVQQMLVCSPFIFRREDSGGFSKQMKQRSSRVDAAVWACILLISVLHVLVFSVILQQQFVVNDSQTFWCLLCRDRECLSSFFMRRAEIDFDVSLNTLVWGQARWVQVRLIAPGAKIHAAVKAAAVY